MKTELIQLTIPIATGVAKIPCADGMQIRIVAVMTTGAAVASQVFFAMAQPGAGDIYIGSGWVEVATTRFHWTVGVSVLGGYESGTATALPIANSPLPDIWFPYGLSVVIGNITLTSAVVMYELRPRT